MFSVYMALREVVAHVHVLQNVLSLCYARVRVALVQINVWLSHGNSSIDYL